MNIVHYTFITLSNRYALLGMPHRLRKRIKVNKLRFR